MFAHLGNLHNYWMSHPGKSAVAGFLYIAFVCVCSAVLGISTDFGPNAQYKGFLTSINWGPLYLIGMPLIIFSVAILFHLLNSALTSLDDILIPASNEISPFSGEFFAQFGSVWRKFILPISIIVSIAIVLSADFAGIFAPTGNFSSATEQDWASVGYKLHPQIHWAAYLTFNILAFFAEGVFAYIASITIFSLAYPLYLFAQYSISGTAESAVNKSIVSHYKLVWKYDDAQGRCGLHKLDKVFITYVAIIGASIAFAIVSVLKNINTTGFDSGSLILVVGVGLLLPLSFVWIILPYWIKFPDKLPTKDQLPAELKNINLPDPKPWPLGSETISWGILAFVSGGWIYLMKLAWDQIIKKYIS